MQSKAPGLVFTALCFIWGSEWMVIKIGLEFFPPFLFTGIVSAIAAIVLMVIVKLFDAEIPRKLSCWSVMVFLGLFQIVLPYGLVFWAEQYIPSGFAALLGATNPVFVVVFARMLVDERLTRFKGLGVIVSFAGLTAIFLKDIVSVESLVAHGSILGSLGVVGFSASGALANVVAKRYAREIHPATNALVQAVTGTVVLSSVALATGEDTTLKLTMTATTIAIYLGAVAFALSYFGLYWLLKKTTATNISLMSFITPIVALAAGWLVLNEVPDTNLGLGAALVLLGVYLTAQPADRFS